MDLKKLITRYLREIADRIDAGTSEVTEEQAMDIIKVVAHEALSKEQACGYLNLSRSRFDELVRQKKIPRGMKRRGYKELVWWKDELEHCKT